VFHAALRDVGDLAEDDLHPASRIPASS